jgi:NADH:ubiquinone oxidoreductase subunit B-like Fe-S oxidoreductase
LTVWIAVDWLIMGCHQTAEALAAPIIEVRNMDPLKEAPAPWQIEVSEEL